MDKHPNMIKVVKESYESTVKVEVIIDGETYRIGKLTPLHWDDKGADQIRLYVDNRFHERICLAGHKEIALFLRAHVILREEYDKMVTLLIGKPRGVLNHWTDHVDYEREIKE